MRRPVQGLVVAVALGSPVGAAPRVDPAPGSVKVEEAIRHGLCWLARHQETDGSWGFASLLKRCTGERSCFINASGMDPSDFHDPGLTGLAILSHLRAG